MFVKEIDKSLDVCIYCMVVVIDGIEWYFYW